MNFRATYLNRAVTVDYSMATDLYEDLDGVIITYDDTGEQIDYDNLPGGEWCRFRELAYTEALGDAIDHAMDMMEDR